jgi:GNAT superfamily N-acetyltransferase
MRPLQLVQHPARHRLREASSIALAHMRKAEQRRLRRCRRVFLRTLWFCVTRSLRQFGRVALLRDGSMIFRACSLLSLWNREMQLSWSAAVCFISRSTICGLWLSLIITSINTMLDLRTLLRNPVWHSLRTNHRHLAVCAGKACRYPAAVAPFVAVARNDDDALEHLRALLTPQDSVYLIGDTPVAVPGLTIEARSYMALQMAGPELLPPLPDIADPSIRITPLTVADAPDMVALTTLAFPGFFRSRTHEMGDYFGIRDSNGNLIAMAGERMCFDHYREISGVCTHPEHTGRGYAKALILHLMHDHRERGLASWLHVGSANRRAIEIYDSLDFTATGEVALHRISLTPA